MVAINKISNMAYQTLSAGVDSFALRMKNGNKMANMQPLKTNNFNYCVNSTKDQRNTYLTIFDCAKLVSTANGSPKPIKYGQSRSMYVNRLCNSQPMLNHLYSNAYNEYSRHMCTRHSSSPTYFIGNCCTTMLWTRNRNCTTIEKSVSAMNLLMAIGFGRPLRNLYAELAMSCAEGRRRLNMLCYLNVHAAIIPETTDC